MPIRAQPSKLVIYVVPLTFVVVSWLISAGFPYYLDSNESFLSYLHARNLEIWDPWGYAWLTAEATDPERATSEGIYSHNPNGPRYLHYLLLQAGVRELSAQVLILTLAGTGLTVALLWRLFQGPELVVVALATVLDFAGFLSWTVNTYRVWSFVLFFSLMLAVVRNRPLWVGGLTFLLLQVEYGFAFFVGVTVCVLAILSARQRAWPIVLASGLGAMLSLTLFGVQVLAFYGWDGFVQELTATYVRRGTAGELSGVTRYAFQAWHGPALLLNMVARETHNPAVLVLVLWGTLSSVFALRRKDLTDEHRLLARLTVSVVVGICAASTVLYGYFVDGFVVSLLPLATFLVAPALGIVALELRRLLSPVVTSPHLGPFATVAVLAPLVAASIAHYQPPVAVELFRLLQSDYQGRTIVAPNLGPWHANPELAFTLTGGRAFRTSDVDATPDDVRRFDGVRDHDGRLTYVCLDTLYIRKLAALGVPSTCERAADLMAARGHQIVADGFGWTVVDIQREDRSPALAANRGGSLQDAGEGGAHGDR
jgi:hypothetical protein